MVHNPEIVEGDMREMRTAGAVAHRPDTWRGCLQPLVDPDIAAAVEFDAGSIEPQSFCVGYPPGGDENIGTFYGPLTLRIAHTQLDLLTRCALHFQEFRIQEHLDALVLKQAQDRFRDVGILVTGELGGTFHDGDPAAESAQGLSKLEPDEPASDDEEVLGQTIQFQRFNVGQRFGFFEAGHIGKGRACADVQKDPIARKNERGAIVRSHLDRLWRHEARFAHNQLGAAVFEFIEVHLDEAVDHLALARADGGHVDRNGTGHNPELRRVTRQIRDLSAVNNVLAWQACDVWARAAD